MKNAILAAGLAALAIPLTPAPAEARSDYWHQEQGYWQQTNHHRARHHRVYDNRGRYYEPRSLSRRDRVWRGNDGRYYCRRDNGTTGLVIGAAVGGLLGNEVAGRGDKTLGAILGAVGGGLLGREIDRGGMKCR